MFLLHVLAMKLDEATWEMEDQMQASILPYSLVEQIFWYMSLVYVFGTCFGDLWYMYICIWM